MLRASCLARSTCINLEIHTSREQREEAVYQRVWSSTLQPPPLHSTVLHMPSGFPFEKALRADKVSLPCSSKAMNTDLGATAISTTAPAQCTLQRLGCCPYRTIFLLSFSPDHRMEREKKDQKETRKRKVSGRKGRQCSPFNIQDLCYLFAHPQPE